MELPPARTPGHELRLFLDGSVAELICDHQHAITSRIYRKPEGPLRISPESSFVQIDALSMWQVRPISRDRLTSPA
jgi:hypothetical protein